MTSGALGKSAKTTDPGGLPPPASPQPPGKLLVLIPEWITLLRDGVNDAVSTGEEMTEVLPTLAYNARAYQLYLGGAGIGR